VGGRLRWETALTGGPHLSAACVRGKVSGPAGGKWAALVWAARRKKKKIGGLGGLERELVVLFLLFFSILFSHLFFKLLLKIFSKNFKQTFDHTIN
jgi:hypothetical protein